jgi:branched-chain amino acid aminotransferase
MYYTPDSQIFLDGQWVRPAEANVSLFSQTMHYGMSVFEGIRAYQTPNGAEIFKAKEHYERLLEGVDLLHMKLPYSVEELIAINKELLARNNLSNAYIRPLVYSGEHMSLNPSSTFGFMMAAWEWDIYHGNNGIRVVTSVYERPNPKSIHMRAKAGGHYVNSVIATWDAKNKGYDEALLYDQHGYLAEASSANVFLQKEGKLLTPELGNILPGITRATIMELAADQGIEVIEGKWTASDVKSAESMFFVGTAAEVVGCASLDDYHFPTPWAESIGAQLAKSYSLLVRGQYQPMVAAS